MIVPTHKCQVCGALWRVNLERDTAEEETWQLCSPSTGECCNNTFMGEQIVPATTKEVTEYLSGDRIKYLEREVEALDEERTEMRMEIARLRDEVASLSNDQMRNSQP